MICTPAQARTLANRLYAKLKNREACEEWCLENLPKEDAITLIGAVINLKYGTPEEVAMPIITRIREDLEKRGFKLPEENKAS